MPDRRSFLKALPPAALIGLLPFPVAFAATPGSERLVLIILRGGLDGLAAVPPLGDSGYRNARPGLALDPADGVDGTIDLDGFFALHPALAPIEPFYRRGQVLIVHATSSPYRGRSHLDGQDLLESGGARVGHVRDGWLNRALGSLGGSPPPALAFGKSVPLVLRGPAPVSSWAPSGLAGLDDDLLSRISALYRDDDLLGPALKQGLETRAMAEAALGPDHRMSRRGARGADAFRAFARVAGAMLRHADGPRVAVIEIGGWDTHANQGGATGQLANRLGALARGLEALATALGPSWERTVVLLATEFGRTVTENGSRGTDHGTGGAAFLLGGAVKGGRVLADWPGLAPGQRFESRDLRATIDLRGVFKGLLRDHIGIAEAALEERVFPDSRNAPPLDGLVRI